MNEVDLPSSFYGYSLLWEPATEQGGQRAKAYYTRNTDSVPAIDQEETPKKPIEEQEWSMQLVHTDYHQYAVGMACRELEGGNKHEENWFMLSREKQPSKFIRRKARQAFIDNGVDVERLVKGPLKDCYGKDMLSG